MQTEEGEQMPITDNRTDPHWVKEQETARYPGLQIHRRFIPALLFLLLLCSSLFASPEVEYMEAYLLSWPETVENTITAPLSWEKSNWLAAGGLLLIGGGLYLADEELCELARRNQSGMGDDLSTVVRQFGEYK